MFSLGFGTAPCRLFATQHTWKMPLYTRSHGDKVTRRGVRSNSDE
jgi:hypothetical protein